MCTVLLWWRSEFHYLIKHTQYKTNIFNGHKNVLIASYSIAYMFTSLQDIEEATRVLRIISQELGANGSVNLSKPSGFFTYHQV